MAVNKSIFRKSPRGKYKLLIILVLAIICSTLFYLWESTSDVPLEKIKYSISDQYRTKFLYGVRETFGSVLAIGMGIKLPRQNLTNLKKRPEPRQNVTGLACKMPDLKPFDWSIRHLVERPNATKCEGRRLTYMKTGRIYLNHSNIDDTNYKVCRLVEPVWENDDFVYDTVSMVHRFSVNTSELKQDVMLDLNISTDFFTVACSETAIGEEDEDYNYDYTFRPSMEEYQYHEGTKEKVNLDAYSHIFPSAKAFKTAAKQLKSEHAHKGFGLNVMMLGVDSTSRMNFLRCMPKSYKFMTETLRAVVMKGYNIVADATTGALIPMLTGKTEAELPEARRSQHTFQTVDAYPLIWKEFKKAGYITMFGEDRPDIAVFNLRLNGFRDVPTDHYMRTFWKHTYDLKQGICLGPDMVHNIVIDYLKDFMTAYPKNLKFGFSFITDLTHSNMNKLSLMDDDLLLFLQHVHTSGILNNTMLVVFADHGARYRKLRRTTQGKLEERLPFMSFILPPWFNQSRPEAFANLETNADRLTTPFDIYSTLQSVLDLKVRKASVEERGISLLSSEVPRERECHHADIADHWCSCLAWEEVSYRTDGWVQEVVTFMVKEINNLTKTLRKSCSELTVAKILSSYRMVPNDSVLKFVRTSDKDQRLPEFDAQAPPPQAKHNITVTYQVTIVTRPGNGEYEATVKVHPQTDRKGLGFEISGEISRITMYGSAADCIINVNPWLAKFCYCRKV